MRRQPGAFANSPAIAPAIDAADQAVIDIRDAFGHEHLSLEIRELKDDPAAQLAVMRKRLLRNDSKGNDQ